MAINITSRFRRAWDVFKNRDPTPDKYWSYGQSYTIRPDRIRISTGVEKTTLNALISRMAIDAASIDILHVKTDDDDNYEELINSGLNYCLRESANIDQTGRALRQDIFTTLLDNGCAAVIPTKYETDDRDPYFFDVKELRVGVVLRWMPSQVEVRIYDETTGEKKDVIVPKSIAVLPENPLYSVLNSPNSTLKRLVRKLSLLDYIDEQTSSGKWNMIIQLPYTVRNEVKRQQAEERRTNVEEQLNKSKYGVAYIDGTEKVIQLNRPIDNSLLDQIKFLKDSLFGELGMTKEIFDGTADEQVQLNYRNNTIEPLISSVVDEMRRKWIPMQKRIEHENIMFFDDPFKLIPVSQISEMSDKLTRNEILSSNEIRQKIGMKPSKDPRADELRNKNINQSNNEIAQKQSTEKQSEEGDDSK